MGLLRTGFVGPLSANFSAPSGGDGYPTSILYATDYNLTENPISEGSIWVKGLDDGLDWQNPQTASSHAYGSTINANGNPAPSGPFDDNIAHIKASRIPFPPDQWIESVIFIAGGYTPSVSDECEHLLRASITAHSATLYECSASLFAGTLETVVWLGAQGSFTSINTIDVVATYGRNYADGDILRSEIRANTIYHYLNGTFLGSVNDSTYTSGQPGIGFWVRSGATLANFAFGYSKFGRFF